MELNKKYIEFLLKNVIGSSIRVQLPKPQEGGKVMWVKLGPVVYMKVDLKVIHKYTRSAVFLLKFDKYEIEQLIFLPIESSPMSISEKLHSKVEKLVYKTFIDDGRREDIVKMYEDKMSQISKMLSSAIATNPKLSNTLNTDKIVK